MHKTKFISILKTLDQKEFRQFNKYIRSSIFTQSKDVIRLYDYIRGSYPTFDSPKLERTIAFIKLFPGRKFDTARFSNLLQKLNNIIENYLIYLKYQQDDFQKKKLLIDIYGERNLNVIFEKNTIKLLRELEHQPYRDSHYFYNSYSLQQGYYLHINTPKQKETVHFLKNALSKLESFFAIEQLRLGIDLKNREKIFAECYDFHPNHLGNISTNNLLYKLLKKAFCFLETEDDALYEEISNIVRNNPTKIPKQELVNLLLLLINYAIRQGAKEEHRYTKDLLDLYKFGLHQKLLIINGSISERTFFNIANIGALLGDFDFVAQFIEDYEQYLDKSHRADTKTLSLGMLYFFQGNYDATLNAVQTFNFSHDLNKLTAKTLLIRTFYHLFEAQPTYYQVLNSHCEAFHSYLKRNNTLSIEKKKAYESFLSLLKSIIRLKHKQLHKAIPKQKKEKLLYELNNSSAIITRGWLQKVIDKL